MRKIQLIWDFQSRDVLAFAKHHAIHLSEFMQAENYALNQTGFEEVSEYHAFAFAVVYEKDVLAFRDLLKPHRALVYKDDDDKARS